MGMDKNDPGAHPSGLPGRLSGFNPVGFGFAAGSKNNAVSPGRVAANSHRFAAQGGVAGRFDTGIERFHIG